MSNTNNKKVATTSVTTNVSTSVSTNAKLTYVTKGGASHNINRASKVGGSTYANAFFVFVSLCVSQLCWAVCQLCWPIFHGLCPSSAGLCAPQGTFS